MHYTYCTQLTSLVNSPAANIGVVPFVRTNSNPFSLLGVKLSEKLEPLLDGAGKVVAVRTRGRRINCNLHVRTYVCMYVIALAAGHLPSKLMLNPKPASVFS